MFVLTDYNLFSKVHIKFPTVHNDNNNCIHDILATVQCAVNDHYGWALKERILLKMEVSRLLENVTCLDGYRLAFRSLSHSGPNTGQKRQQLLLLGAESGIFAPQFDFF